MKIHRSDYVDFVQMTLAQLDTPVSLGISILIENGEWDQIIGIKIDPLRYIDCLAGARLYLRDAQALALVKKAPDLPTTVDKEAVATDVFWACEKQCKRTNDRLDRHLNLKVLRDPAEEMADRLLIRARAWIASILGTVPSRLDGRFGPGATFESKSFGDSALGLTIMSKLSHIPTATAGSVWLHDHLVWETALADCWSLAAPTRVIPIVRGNRFTTVPKDSTKNRGIAIEPGLNVWAQLAVGGAIRRRLRIRAGIDLSTGQELHRNLACNASRDGGSATIDLSNASDTVSTALVKILLPEPWYDLLVSLRSPFTQVGGEWVKLEKFSSMGNGFTFELETLIFLSLCHACGGKVGIDTFGYGDDLIIPTDITRDVVAFLAYCGMTTNVSKSFSTGSFRESCGGDYMDGIEVRPFYVKTQPSTPEEWIAVINGLLSHEPSWTRRVVNWCLNKLPRQVRKCRGPRRLGDICIHLPVTPKTRWCIDYYRVWKPVTPKVKLTRYGGEVQLVSALLGASSEGVSPRDSISGYKLGWASSS